MRKYWFLFKIALQNRLADRANFYLEILGNTMVLLAVIAVWSAAASGRTAVSGLAREQLIVYLIAANVLTGFYRRSQGDEISDDIYHGTLSVWLVKPMSALRVWFIRDFAIRVIEFPFVAAVAFILAYTFRVHEVLTLSFERAFSFFVFAILAMLLHYWLYTGLSLLAFWLEQTWGERFVFNVVMEIASGAFIPLMFFPPLWQGVLRALPLSQMVATPVEFLLGMRTVEESWGVVALMLFWLGASVAMVRMLWKRGLRRYEGVGI